MKILDTDQRIGIIPDVHTRLDKLQAFIDKYDGQVDHWVQMGDWFDAFKPKADAESTALFLKERLHDPKWTILWGNHDVHYYGGPACSGYNSITHSVCDALLEPKDWDKFHLAAEIVNSYNPVLISHAGITHIRPAFKYTDSIDDVQDYILDAEMDLKTMRFKHRLLQAGKSRGGWAHVGGIYWLDWREMVPFKNFTQVVGHTFYRGDKPLVKRSQACIERAYCLDNGLRQIMIWEDGKLHHHSLKELDGDQ